jgi:hypothetical protein|uniref:Uncharacterized protein n=1 Tax=Myoviridae sp. ctBoB21 TaxID=2827287 RepID=A0A8S5R6C6_9CAUD|nr:MAG TPA: hypothetical protein [Myoviridae sp. ctBoB21]
MYERAFYLFNQINYLNYGKKRQDTGAVVQVLQLREFRCRCNVVSLLLRKQERYGRGL